MTTTTIYPHPNDERIIQTFAILPIQIGHEMAWFETVYIRQRYKRDIGVIWNNEGWVNIEFVSKKEYEIFNDINYYE